MLLPISRAQFDEEAQTQYIRAIAAAANLPVRFVEIISITEIDARRALVVTSRRLLAANVEVETRINIPINQQIASVTSGLTQRAINQQLPEALRGELTQEPALPPCGAEGHNCSVATLPPGFLPAPTALPEGVTAGPRGEEEGMDLGPCVCDLTARICDANCECDGDCSEDEKGRFTTEFGVGDKVEGLVVDIGECVDKDQFLRINAPIVREDSPVCVLVNNNPSLGDFFTPPGAFVTDNEVRLEFANVGEGPWVPYEPPAQPDTTAYQVGMRIPTALATSELGSTDPECSEGGEGACVPGVYGAQGFLSLRYPGPEGRCVAGNFVQFWEGTEETGPCVEGGAVEEVCGRRSGLSAGLHLERLQVAKRPSQLGQITDWPDQTKWLRLDTDVRVLVRDGEGGALYSTRTELPQPYWDARSSRCVNVLRELHYTLVRDQSGGIEAVSVAVQLEHAAPDERGEVWVQQRFSAAFVDGDAPTQPELLAPLQRSGNPGYVSGKPVLAGYANATLPAGADGSTLEQGSIAQLLGGLRLPRMAGPDGRCRLCATSEVAGGWVCNAPEGLAVLGAGGAEEGVGVLFGEDMVQGCEVQLSRAELAAFCSSNQLHPLLRYDERLRIGIWGDAHPANAYDWLPTPDASPQYLATEREPGASQSWDQRGVCSRAPTSVHYQILTADVGNVKNPQRKVLGARIEYGVADLRADFPDDDTRNTYFLSASVSFLRIDDGGSVEVVPPPPSILPVLPDDIFYPFSGSPAAPRAAPSPATAAASLLLAAALLLRAHRAI